MATLAAHQQLSQAASLLERGRLEESTALFRALLSTPAYAAKAYYGLGLIRMRCGDWPAAHEYLLAAVRLNPRDANALFYLGEIARRQGQQQQSREAYRKALAANPAHRGALERMRALTPPAAPAPAPAAAPAAPAPAPGTGFSTLLAEDKSPAAMHARRLIDAIDRNVTLRLSAYLGELLGGAFAGVVMFVAMLIVAGELRRGDDQAIAGLIGVLLLVAPAIATILRVKTSNVQFSHGRVKISTGVLSKDVVNAELYRVIDIDLRRSLINRLTGDGSIRLKLADHGREKTVVLKGVARGAALDAMFENLRDLILILRSGNWGKGVIY